MGTGLYGMLAFVLLSVFIAGLMVGRAPEWLGKKIQSREVKLASLTGSVPPSASSHALAAAEPSAERAVGR